MWKLGRWAGVPVLAWMSAWASACSAPPTCEGDPCCGVECCGTWLEEAPDGSCRARPWPAEDRFSLSAAGADSFEVAVDGLGQALVSWRRRVSDDPFARSVLAEQTADGWKTHALGGADTGVGSRVTLATRGLEVWATWSQQRRTPGGDDESSVYLRRRAPNGAWMSDASGEQLSFAPRAFEPVPVLPSNGEGLIIWNQATPSGNYGVALAEQPLGEPGLLLPDSPEDVLSPPVFFSNSPQIAVGGNGDAVVTWYQATPPPDSSEPSPPSDGLRLFVSERFRADGTFSRPAIEDWISPEGPPLASHEIRNPVVAVGDFGEALVFWSQEHPSGATGLFSASRDGFGEWTTPEDIDDTFGPLRDDAACIEVVFAPTGEAHVTWFDGPAGATTVYTARRSLEGRWDDPLTAPVSTDGRPAQDPRIAVGPAGEAVVVWSERGEDQRWRVMGRRRGPNASSWGTSVELSDPSEGDALGPAVAIGPDGTLAAAWGVGPIGAQTVSVAVLP